MPYINLVLVSVLFGAANWIVVSAHLHSTMMLISVVISLVLFLPGAFLYYPQRWVSEHSVILLLFCSALGLHLSSNVMMIMLTDVPDRKLYLFLLWCVCCLAISISAYRFNASSSLILYLAQKAYAKGLTVLWYGVISLLLFIVIYFGMVLSPLQYDLETFQLGSSYGLVSCLKPIIWPVVPDNTFREVNYSRTPLAHFFTAWSMLLSGHILETEAYFRSVYMPMESRPYPRKFYVQNRETQYPDRDIANAGGGDGEGVRLLVEPALDISSAQLIASRLPQGIALLLSVFVVYHLLVSLKVSHSLALLGSLLYFTFPEVFIRGVSATTQSMTWLFSALLMQRLPALRGREDAASWWELALISGVCFWINQKSAVILPGYVLWRLLAGESINKVLRSAVVQGFIFGFILYSAYGIAMDPTDYFHAFLGEQAMFRFDFIRIPPPEDRIYPDALNLLIQFAQFTNPLLFVIAVVLLVRCAWKQPDGEGAFYFWWFFCAMFLGSIIDRRMTRHLMVGLLPLLPMTVLYMDSWRWRKIPIGSLLFVVLSVVDGFHTWYIISHFRTYGPLPTW